MNSAYSPAKAAPIVRDPHGASHHQKQYTFNEPHPSLESAFTIKREENSRLLAHTAVLEIAGLPFAPEGRLARDPQNQIQPSYAPQAPKVRRVLPTRPAWTVADSVTAMRDSILFSTKETFGFDEQHQTPRSHTQEQFSPDNIRVQSNVCPTPLVADITCKFCTSTGQGTCLKCINCDNKYCMACLNSNCGSMFSYDSEGAPVLSCPKCSLNPRSLPNKNRPEWIGLGLCFCNMYMSKLYLYLMIIDFIFIYLFLSILVNYI